MLEYTTKYKEVIKSFMIMNIDPYRISQFGQYFTLEQHSC